MFMSKENMENLVKYLNYHTNLYNKGCPEISDIEWDKHYFELCKLEKEEGYVLADSPTQKINYVVMDKLNQVLHNHSMLSLNKTKDINEIQNFISDKSCIAMAKMDGLTCSLYYENGRLKRAETRGNGIIGEDVTHNVLTVTSVPHRIPYTEPITIDGEIICKYNDYEKYKSRNSKENWGHIRNYAAGSIRLLNSKECNKRELTFIAWDAFENAENSSIIFDTLSHKLQFLSEYFLTVPYAIVTTSDIQEKIEYIRMKANEYEYPIDGVVFKYDDVKYYNKLGCTAHHFRGGLAYKFEDEIFETTLKNIEWTMGRTGVLTPVAVFEPVNIDDTEIKRADLSNVSIKNKILGHSFKGQRIKIYKSNMIKPVVKEAEQAVDYGSYEWIENPDVCPICGEKLEIKDSDNSTFLYCPNSKCKGKLINVLDHFCSKECFDIKGLSSARIEFLIKQGWLNSSKDIFYLKDHREEWIKKPGFGEKSVDKILQDIENKKQISFVNFVTALGIPLIGKSVAKELNKQFSSYADFREAINNNYAFYNIPTFGEKKHASIMNFNYSEGDDIAKLVSFIDNKTNTKAISNSSDLEGLVFVITGKLKHFKNRDLLKNEIESKGGRVSNAMSSKVNYLINNDINSTTSKNVFAKEHNIPVISEEEYLTMIQK